MHCWHHPLCLPFCPEADCFEVGFLMQMPIIPLLLQGQSWIPCSRLTLQRTYGAGQDLAGILQTLLQMLASILLR